MVVFNPDVDLALLYVPGLGEPPLKLGTRARGQTGAVFGHPNGQDALAVQPAAIATEVTALGQDLYDTRNTQRNVFVLAAKLAYGDSGAPLVDTHGQVVGHGFRHRPRPAHHGLRAQLFGAAAPIVPTTRGRGEHRGLPERLRSGPND